jgi:anti-sigma-K factor RskA
MKYQDRQLQRMLAAEYVLGTLHGAARRRFQRLLQREPELAQEVLFWEQRLAALLRSFKPVTPPPTVWIGLLRRLEQQRVVLLPQPGRKRALPRVLAGLAAAAAVALLLVFAPWRSREPESTTATSAPAATYVAQLNMPQASMHWTVSLAPDRGRMRVAASGEAPGLGDRSPELWWISPKGPVSLGVLPTQGEGSMNLPKGMPNEGELSLAVSLEPHGGSPTGQPTGPVVISAKATRQA